MIAPSPCPEGMVQRSARHFPAGKLAVAFVQVLPARQVAQLEECCCLGHSPDRHLLAKINVIQTNDFIHTVLMR